MVDQSFFPVKETLTIGDVLAISGGQLIGGDPNTPLSGLAAVEAAGPGDLCSVHNKTYKARLEDTNASLCLTTPQLLQGIQPKGAVIACDKPYLAFALAGSRMFAEWPAIVPGIHARAIVDDSAHIHSSAQISAGAVISAGVTVGEGSFIGPNVVLERNVQVGRHTAIHAGSFLAFAKVGDRCLIHSNVSIGNRGYGFTPGPEGLVNLPHLGLVHIGNDVEIGAGCVIDRGSVRDTRVGDGSKLDSLITLGHNVQVGRMCTIVAQVGIAGSTTLEDFVVIGGHSGISGHITLGMGTQIGPFTGVMKSTTPGQEVLSFPPMTAKEFFRRQVGITKLLKREGLV